MVNAQNVPLDMFSLQMPLETKYVIENAIILVHHVPRVHVLLVLLAII